jgi:hypothetical protein
MNLRTLAAACQILVGVAATTTVHAAIYTGTFDPNDGTYEWSGTHVFDVSDACLSGTGWMAANDGYSGCTVTLTGGSLTLARVAESSPAGPFALNFLDFPSALGNPYDIWGVYVQDGELKGVDSWLIGGFNFTPAQQAALGFAGRDFYLRWESGKAAADDPNVLALAGPGYGITYNFSSDPVYLYQTSSVCGPGECTPAEVTPGVSATDVVFTRLAVPEPASFGLAGIALLGAICAGRRRRRG